MKKTILIFGISSTVGSALAELLATEYRIIGTYFKNKVKKSSILTLPCDVLESDQVQRIIYRFKPDYTIYAVGLSKLGHCDEFPKLSDALNTIGLINVSTYTERYQSQIIYFSAPYIFAGEDTLTFENDTPMPNSVYGQTLASSEFYIQRSCLNYLIFRCANFFHRSFQMFELNWFEYLERKLVQNEIAKMDDTVTTGFLSIDSLKDALVASIENGVTNRLFQLSSIEYGTHYDFSLKFAKVFGYDSSLLAKDDWGFPENLDQVPSRDKKSDLCYKMDISNARDFLGLSANSIEQEIIRYHQRIKGQTKTKKSQVSGQSGGVTYI